MTAERDLTLLLAGLRPQAQPGTYVFAVAPAWAGDLVDEAVVAVREPEGLTLVLPREAAERHGLSFAFEAAWVTLMVHSALDAVGLTAVVAAAMAKRGISCNVVAGYHHDDLFVPAERLDDALDALRTLGVP